MNVAANASSLPDGDHLSSSARKHSSQCLPPSESRTSMALPRPPLVPRHGGADGAPLGAATSRCTF